MSDAYLIDPYGPFEVRIFLPSNPGPDTSLIVAVTGFVWWKLASLNATWANPAGIPNLFATVFLTQSNNFLCSIPHPTIIASGTAVGVSFVLGAPNNAASTQTLAQTLPDVYVVGDGSIGAGFDGGVAGKTISSIVCSVYGKRARRGP